eukprot:Clim_evm19s231 gene=Clim_evmTU19s231
MRRRHSFLWSITGLTVVLLLLGHAWAAETSDPEVDSVDSGVQSAENKVDPEHDVYFSVQGYTQAEGCRNGYQNLEIGLFQGDDLYRIATTDGVGRYEFIDVPPGEYAIRTLHEKDMTKTLVPDEEEKDVKEFEQPDQPSDMDGRQKSIRPSWAIPVKVVDRSVKIGQTLTVVGPTVMGQVVFKDQLSEGTAQDSETLLELDLFRRMEGESLLLERSSLIRRSGDTYYYEEVPCGQYIFSLRDPQKLVDVNLQQGKRMRLSPVLQKQHNIVAEVSEAYFVANFRTIDGKPLSGVRGFFDGEKLAKSSSSGNLSVWTRSLGYKPIVQDGIDIQGPSAPGTLSFNHTQCIFPSESLASLRQIRVQNRRQGNQDKVSRTYICERVRRCFQIELDDFTKTGNIVVVKVFTPGPVSVPVPEEAKRYQLSRTTYDGGELVCDSFPSDHIITNWALPGGKQVYVPGKRPRFTPTRSMFPFVVPIPMASGTYLNSGRDEVPSQKPLATISYQTPYIAGQVHLLPNTMQLFPDPKDLWSRIKVKVKSREETVTLEPHAVQDQQHEPSHLAHAFSYGPLTTTTYDVVVDANFWCWSNEHMSLSVGSGGIVKPVVVGSTWNSSSSDNAYVEFHQIGFSIQVQSPGPIDLSVIKVGQGDDPTMAEYFVRLDRKGLHVLCLPDLGPYRILPAGERFHFVPKRDLIVQPSIATLFNSKWEVLADLKPDEWTAEFVGHVSVPEATVIHLLNGKPKTGEAIKGLVSSLKIYVMSNLTYEVHQATVRLLSVGSMSVYGRDVGDDSDGDEEAKTELLISFQMSLPYVGEWYVVPKWDDRAVFYPAWHTIVPSLASPVGPFLEPMTAVAARPVSGCLKPRARGLPVVMRWTDEVSMMSKEDCVFTDRSGCFTMHHALPLHVKPVLAPQERSYEPLDIDGDGIPEPVPASIEENLGLPEEAVEAWNEVSDDRIFVTLKTITQGTILISLFDNRAQPFEDVTILLSSATGYPLTRERSDSKGHVQFDGLDAGSYIVLAEGSDPKFSPASKVLALKQGGTASTVLIGKRINVSVGGVLRDATGTPVADASFSVSDAKYFPSTGGLLDGPKMDLSTSHDSSTPIVYKTVSGRDGHFVLKDLQPYRQYVVSVNMARLPQDIIDIAPRQQRITTKNRNQMNALSFTARSLGGKFDVVGHVHCSPRHRHRIFAVLYDISVSNQPEVLRVPLNYTSDFEVTGLKEEKRMSYLIKVGPLDEDTAAFPCDPVELTFLTFNPSTDDGAANVERRRIDLHPNSCRSLADSIMGGFLWSELSLLARIVLAVIMGMILGSAVRGLVRLSKRLVSMVPESASSGGGAGSGDQSAGKDRAILRRQLRSSGLRHRRWASDHNLPELGNDSTNSVPTDEVPNGASETDIATAVADNPANWEQFGAAFAAEELRNSAGPCLETEKRKSS